MTLADAISKFLLACKLRKLSPHTQRAYRSDLWLFRKWSHNRELERALTPDEIKAWRCHMDDRPLAATSIKRRLATLKAFTKWLEKAGHLNQNPFLALDLPIKLPRRLPRNLQNGDLRELIRSVRTRSISSSFPQVLIHLSVELILSTGIRIGEACNIELDDINLQERIIRVHGKGSRERQVFLIDKKLVVLIKRYLAIRKKFRPLTDRLLITTRGTSASTDYIRRKLHEAVSETGITRKVTPHMLRHTAATQFLERGVDIRYVQRLLGHSSIATTEIYTHVSNTALRDAITGAQLRKQWE